jgi:phosphohistidine swiveling domain-containing protein
MRYDNERNQWDSKREETKNKIEEFDQEFLKELFGEEYYDIVGMKCVESFEGVQAENKESLQSPATNAGEEKRIPLVVGLKRTVSAFDAEDQVRYKDAPSSKGAHV